MIHIFLPKEDLTGENIKGYFYTYLPWILLTLFNPILIVARWRKNLMKISTYKDTYCRKEVLE